MAKFDPELVDRMRDAMDMRPGIAEKKMFGGIFFMLNGNMLCAVTGHGLMFRVGAEREEDALLRPGARAMDVTKRPMPGFIRVDADEALELGLDDWVNYASQYVGGLPLKEPKGKRAK